MKRVILKKADDRVCATCRWWPRAGMGAARKCPAIDRVTIAEAPACDHWEKDDDDTEGLALPGRG